MGWFEKALEANVMSTRMLIRANVSRSVLLEAYRIATDFEARYSAYRQDSWLNEVNRQAGCSPVSCTQEDYALLRLCLDLCEATQGAFDITVGALTHSAYRFGFVDQTVPQPNIIEQAKSLVDYRRISLTSSRIFLPLPGMRLDLGAIGKGYVARRIARFLLDQGAKKLLVNVGGEIVTYGKRYRIGLKSPFEDGFFGYLTTPKSSCSVSTSGSYERFIDTGHYHILDISQGRSPRYFSALTLVQHSLRIDKLDAFATAMFTYSPLQALVFSKKHSLAMIALDPEGNRTINTLTSSFLGNVRLYR